MRNAGFRRLIILPPSNLFQRCPNWPSMLFQLCPNPYFVRLPLSNMRRGRTARGGRLSCQTCPLGATAAVQAVPTLSKYLFGKASGGGNVVADGGGMVWRRGGAGRSGGVRPYRSKAVQRLRRPHGSARRRLSISFQGCPNPVGARLRAAATWSRRRRAVVRPCRSKAVQILSAQGVRRGLGGGRPYRVVSVQRVRWQCDGRGCGSRHCGIGMEGATMFCPPSSSPPLDSPVRRRSTAKPPYYSLTSPVDFRSVQPVPVLSESRRRKVLGAIERCRPYYAAVVQSCPRRFRLSASC